MLWIGDRLIGVGEDGNISILFESMTNWPGLVIFGYGAQSPSVAGV